MRSYLDGVRSFYSFISNQLTLKKKKARNMIKKTKKVTPKNKTRTELDEKVKVRVKRKKRRMDTDHIRKAS